MADIRKFHNSPIFPPNLIGTGHIESLYLMVASLQVSAAGQNISKISGIFKFDVYSGV